MSGRSNASRLSATSREPEEWAAATETAREVRAATAHQVEELIIAGDVMGSRGALTARLEKLLEAESREATAKRARRHARLAGISEVAALRAEQEAQAAVRAAVMDIAVAAGQWAAAIDFQGRQLA